MGYFEKASGQREGRAGKGAGLCAHPARYETAGRANLHRASLEQLKTQSVLCSSRFVFLAVTAGSVCGLKLVIPSGLYLFAL